MSGYEIIDHTADIGIRVWGKTPEELFVNAAEGMIDIIVRAKPRTMRCGAKSRTRSLASRLAPIDIGARSKSIGVKAVDKEQLLVKWLQEILYLFESKKFLPVSFKISNIKGNSLSANVYVVPFDSRRHSIKHHIKAVTYHNLAVRKTPRGFETTMIFDI